MKKICLGCSKGCSIKLKSGYLPPVPVKTKKAVNKEKIFEMMEIIRELEIESPVYIGNVVVTDLAGTGVERGCT
ncbi:DUF1667 domain-containing protein [Acetobacterium woodii]|uniref:DUF1667 domain-containing protein n=1 Tax=Acetobacterium woodii (strain ATCC 29683 / DSM 1030 / JCM 2381 / KCTC 1655 / WB1) TaxID=931626 RepID=H6LD64_ACEWD|nr:DUF1667 domain-containing protein [Acetobacterium woodii]AFA49109.1 hypothetical protein Awo_c23360 [Acetobacterium woodii DSM 1030]